LILGQPIFEKHEINSESTDNQKSVFVTCAGGNEEETLNYFSKKKSFVSFSKGKLFNKF
jgi:hypothetical protein